LCSCQFECKGDSENYTALGEQEQHPLGILLAATCEFQQIFIKLVWKHHPSFSFIPPQKEFGEVVALCVLNSEERLFL